MILCLWTTYVIFIHWDRQLSLRFHFFFEWVTSIYTEINRFPDDFMSWTRCAIFIRWILNIFWVPYKKTTTTTTDSTMWHSMLSLVRNKKNLKIKIFAIMTTFNWLSVWCEERDSTALEWNPWWKNTLMRTSVPPKLSMFHFLLFCKLFCS